MRKVMFWLGWTIFILLPIAFIAEIVIIQDLPKIEPWQWAIPVVAYALVTLGRNRDDVLKHHLV